MNILKIIPVAISLIALSSCSFNNGSNVNNSNTLNNTNSGTIDTSILYVGSWDYNTMASDIGGQVHYDNALILSMQKVDKELVKLLTINLNDNSITKEFQEFNKINQNEYGAKLRFYNCASIIKEYLGNNLMNYFKSGNKLFAQVAVGSQSTSSNILSGRVELNDCGIYALSIPEKSGDLPEISHSYIYSSALTQIIGG